MARFHAEEKAVGYMRAAPTFKIRSNKYRSDLGLKPENIQFENHLRSTGKYVHLGVIDTGTTAQLWYDLKLQVINDEEQWRQSLDPFLSPNSEDRITSPQKVKSERLIAKRHNEIRVYLRYIKNGHDTIKHLEAFHQYRDGDDKLIVAQYFRLCDGGNVKQLRMDYTANRKKPPEMFMWKMYLQLIDALAFLHNEHPKYQNDPLHLNRKSILNPELGAENVYLEWPKRQEPDTCYPDIRLGDFGKSLVVSPEEGFVENENKTNVNPKYKPPELNLISTKSDVWRAGSIIFSLTKLGQSTSTKRKWKGSFADLTEEEQQRIVMDPRRVRPIDLQYSEDLDIMIKRSLVLDHNERPSAGQLLSELKGPAALRLNTSFMFKALPDWVGDKPITEDNVFLLDRLNELAQPGVLEGEQDIRKKKRAVQREEKRLLRKKLKEKEREEAKKREEGKLETDIWALWAEREENLETITHIPLADIDAMFERWRKIRLAGLAEGVWVDPGPSYEQYKKMDATFDILKL